MTGEDTSRRFLILIKKFKSCFAIKDRDEIHMMQTNRTEVELARYLKQLELKIGKFPFTIEVVSSLIAPTTKSTKNKIVIDLTKEEQELLDWIKERHGDIFIKAAKYRNERLLDFLMKCGVDLNYTDEKSCIAADYAWRNKNYKILLLLLQENSFFPHRFNVHEFREDDEYVKGIKSLAHRRNRLHEVIKNDDVEDVKKLQSSERSKMCVNTVNESVIYTALKHKKFVTYAYLKSIGAEFAKASEELELNQLNEAEKLELEDAMIQYFPSVSNSHIYYLVSKTRSQKPVLNLTSVVMNYYVILDSIPEISVILKTIQYADYLDIIFDFDEIEITKVNLMADEYTAGEAKYKDGRIFIAAGLNDQREILGTLAHELTHMAMQILYTNDCDPYGKSDEASISFFRNLKDLLKNRLDENLLGPSKMFLNVLKNYSEIEQDSELIVCVPHILVQFNDGWEWLEGNVPELLEFYKKTIEPKCEEFIKGSVVLKPKSAIRSINESVGEIMRLRACEIFFKNLNTVPDLFRNGKKIFLYKVKNTFLGVLKMLQGIFGKEYRNSYNNFLVLKFNTFMSQTKEIEDAFHSEASNIMIIEIDNTPTDYELSEACKVIWLFLLKRPNKKIVFVTCPNATRFLLENLRRFDLTSSSDVILDDDFALDHLDSESQKNILSKTIKFQGKPTTLNSLIQDEKLYKFITPTVLTSFIEGRDVNIGNEISGLTSLDGAYIDVVLEINFESLIREIKNSNDIFIIRPGLKSESDKYLFRYLSDYFEGTWINTEYFTSEIYNFESKIFLEKIILVNEHFLNGDFRNFCKSNAERKCYLVEVAKLEKNSSFVLQQIYNPNFYMERKVKKVFVKGDEIHELISESSSDAFVIIGALNLRNDFERYDNVILLEEEEARYNFRTLSETGTTVHLFQMENERFVWKDSCESVEEIRNYGDHMEIGALDEIDLISEIIHKKCMLIADDPGMGKSTTLTKLYEARPISDTHWIIRINLKDYLKAIRDHTESLNIEKIIRFLQEIEPSLKNELDENLLMTALTHDNKFSKCLLFAFDGFDEILDEDDREKVINLLKFLKTDTPSKIWITSRLQYKEELERHLETFAIEFDPFDDDMKKLFVVKYLKDRLNLVLNGESFAEVFGENEDAKIWTFSENLLRKMEQIFKVDVAKLIGTPLQLNLVMFDSLKYFKNWVENGSDLDFSYIGDNLLDVYKNFIGKKYDVYFEKFGKIVKDDQRREKKISEKYYEELAESLVYKRRNLKPGEEEKQLILSIGLIQMRSDNFEFIHFTIREYYFAQTFADFVLGEIEESQDFHEKIEFLFKEVFVKREFEMICNFLNVRLREQVPERNLKALKNICLLADILKPFSALDSVFGVVAKKGYENIFYFIYSIYYLLTTTSPAWKITNILNRPIFYNATHSQKPQIWEVIFDILKKLKLNLNKWEKIYYNCLIEGSIVLAIRHKYWELTKLLLLKVKENYPANETRQLFIGVHKKYSYLLNVIILMLEVGEDLFSPLELINFFTSKHTYCPSAFSMAANENDAEYMKILLGTSGRIMRPEDEGRLLTMRNQSDGTILHTAVRSKDSQITALILDRAEKILSLKEQREFFTAMDYKSRTALHLAVYKNRIETVKLLTETGEKVLEAETLAEFFMIKNNENQTVLHSAIDLNRIDIATLLTKKGKEILKSEKFRELITTADNTKGCIFYTVMNRSFLHLPDCKDRIELIKLLFFGRILPRDEQCQLLMRKHPIYGSLFHLAAYLGDVEFLNFILRKGEEILTSDKLREFLMMEKENGQTSFHLSVKNGIEVVKLLFETNERILSSEDQRRLMSAEDKSGESVLHKAAFSYKVEVVEYVLDKCEKLLDFKQQRELFIMKTEKNSNFFHRFVSYNKIEIIELLLEISEKVLTTEEYRQLLMKKDRVYGSFFHAAASNEDGNVAKLITNVMERFLVPNQQRELLTMTDENGHDCLLFAVKKNRLEMTSSLFEKFDEIFDSEQLSRILMTTDKNGQTCLHLAAGKNRVEMMTYLFDKILTLGHETCQLLTKKNNSEGNTILHEIACTNQLDLLKLFFEQIPAEIQRELLMATDFNNLTVLHKSIKLPDVNIKIPKLILKKMERILTPPQQRDFLMASGKMNETVFYTVVALNKTEILRLLLHKAKSILIFRDQMELMMKEVDFSRFSKSVTNPKFHGNRGNRARTTPDPYSMEDDDTSNLCGTMLHEAAYNGQPEILDLLLENINEIFPPKEKLEIVMMKNSKNQTFFSAVLSYRHNIAFEILKLLFDKLHRILTPGDLRQLLMITDSETGSVLHVVASNHSYETAKLLFDEVEKILSGKELHELFTTKAERFGSVLHAAIMNGEPKVVRFILNKGKQVLTSKEQIEVVTMIDANNRTFLHLIDFNNKESEFIFLFLEEWGRLLTAKKQSKLLAVEDRDHRTALHMAVMNGKLEAVKLLIQQAEKIMSRKSLKIFLRVKDVKGETALEMGGKAGYDNHLIKSLIITFMEENRISNDLVTEKKKKIFEYFS